MQGIVHASSYGDSSRRDSSDLIITKASTAVSISGPQSDS
jgi:hypothetical protein